MGARQPTPNRWLGPLGTHDNPGGRKENEEFRKRMEGQIHEDGFVIRDCFFDLNVSVIDAFIEAEEDPREGFVEQYGWLVAGTLLPLYIPEETAGLQGELTKEEFMAVAEQNEDKEFEEAFNVAEVNNVRLAFPACAEYTKDCNCGHYWADLEKYPEILEMAEQFAAENNVPLRCPNVCKRFAEQCCCGWVDVAFLKKLTPEERESVEVARREEVAWVFSMDNGVLLQCEKCGEYAMECLCWRIWGKISWGST